MKVPLLKNISRSLQVAAVISQASSILTRRGDWSLWELGATSKRGQADASAVSVAVEDELSGAASTVAMLVAEVGGGGSQN